MRVAFLPDSFHEVNGVAHTARHFTAYAERHGLPFLSVRAGLRSPALHQQGSVLSLELPRSRASFRLEKDLSFDPFFFRHGRVLGYVLRHFQPDVLHITGPSELGMLGAYFAWKYGIPLAASWHTNVHEYAARRMQWLKRISPSGAGLVEAGSFDATMRFYRLARMLFAPNEDLCSMLKLRTGTPCHLMRRGVDTELFHPARRAHGDSEPFLLGYVGRLSVEKQVTLFPEIQNELRRRGVTNTRFRIVGQGAEEAQLRRALPDAEFLGLLKGEALASAYAGMDLFIFPSETDTFGNVVLEAMSSGVPALVTHGGGPKFIVRDSVTGLVRHPSEFGASIAQLVRDPVQLSAMSRAARDHALTYSWDSVFDQIYEVYHDVLSPTQEGEPV